MLSFSLKSLHTTTQQNETFRRHFFHRRCDKVDSRVISLASQYLCSFCGQKSERRYFQRPNFATFQSKRKFSLSSRNLSLTSCCCFALLPLSVEIHHGYHVSDDFYYYYHRTRTRTTTKAAAAKRARRRTGPCSQHALDNACFCCFHHFQEKQNGSLVAKPSSSYATSHHACHRKRVVV